MAFFPLSSLSFTYETNECSETVITFKKIDQNHRSLFWHISHTVVSKTGLKYNNMNYKRHRVPETMEPVATRQEQRNLTAIETIGRFTVTSEALEILVIKVILNKEIW